MRKYLPSNLLVSLLLVSGTALGAGDLTPTPSTPAGIHSTGILKLVAKPKPNAYVGDITTQNQIPSSIYKKYEKIIDKGVTASESPSALPHNIRKSLHEFHSKISNELVAEKEQAFHQLGINAKGTGTLYILVSSSMPMSMLRQYAAAAIYTGGIIDFRGVLANKPSPLTWFLKHKILPLLTENPRARPTVTIDPRPFNAWGVKVVPAIIYTQVPNIRLCPRQVVHKTVADNYLNKKIVVPYHVCAPMNPKKYWEIQGDVTVRYALSQFIQHGAASAKPLLKALEKGQLPTGKNIVGMKESAYQKMITPGGVDTVLNAMKSEGYYSYAPDAGNIANPGDFSKPELNSVLHALNSQPAKK